MELVGSGAKHHVQYAAGHLAVLGGIAGHFHLELLHGVHVGPQLRRGAPDVAVVEAVHAEVGIVASGAVDGRKRAGAALRVGQHTRHQECQFGKVAAVERNVLDLRLDNHVAFYAPVLRVQRRDFSGDVDRLGHRSDRQAHIASQGLPDLEHDAFLVDGVEALFLGDKLVGAGREIGNSERTLRVRDHRAGDIGFDVADGNVHPGRRSLRRIRHNSGHGGEIALRGQNARQNKHERQVSRQDRQIPTPLRKNCNPG